MNDNYTLPKTFYDYYIDLKNKYQNNPDEGGRVFEKLIIRFLQNDNQFKQDFDKVYTWTEWRLKYQGNPSDRFNNENDSGIDLVLEKTLSSDKKEFAAVQCKFYKKEHKLNHKDYSTFIADLSSSRKIFKSGYIIDTGDQNLTEATKKKIDECDYDVFRITTERLNNSSIDWNHFYHTNEITSKEDKELRLYQKDAINNVVKQFETNDRGKLIMACGTGKTLVSLKIIEKMLGDKGGLVLFVVPSLLLVNQTLNSFNNDLSKNTKFKTVLVCSKTPSLDAKKELDPNSIPLSEIIIKRTTDSSQLIKALDKLKDKNPVGINVVFSTYHSLNVICDAQKEEENLLFDLLICDEAHRSCSVKKDKNNQEATNLWSKLHYNDNINIKKRLYMTATPVIYKYNTSTKETSEEKLVTIDKIDIPEKKIKIISMDDESIYGSEFYRYDFRSAITKGHLANYKIYCLDFPLLQGSSKLTDFLNINKIGLDVASRWIGIYKSLCGITYDTNFKLIQCSQPLKRVFGFANTIKNSKRISGYRDDSSKLKNIIDIYKNDIASDEEKPYLIDLEFRHIDGTYSSNERNEAFKWLQKTKKNVCKIITNVNCLSEGVDVPNLDGIVFFDPRQSETNIIQCIGRALRPFDGKEFGKIIVPTCVSEEEISNIENHIYKKQVYRSIIKVIGALKSIDINVERLITQWSLLKNGDPLNNDDPSLGSYDNVSDVPFDEGEQQKLVENPIVMNTWLAKEVMPKAVKVWSYTDYWKRFIEYDVKQASEELNKRLEYLQENEKDNFFHFVNKFKQVVHTVINNSVEDKEIFTWVSQHIMVQPIFQAIFANHEQLNNTPIAKAMQNFIDDLDTKFHILTNKVKNTIKRFEKIIQDYIPPTSDHAVKQNFLILLYEYLFKFVYPDIASNKGIKPTPIEVVDFQLNGIQLLLKKHFQTNLSQKNISVIDPFSGTGTYLCRLLHLDLIEQEALPHKYHNELFSNEILLLPYYISNMNIQNEYISLANEQNNFQFQGALYGDTFEMYEREQGITSSYSETAPLFQYQTENQKIAKTLIENNKRWSKQKNAPIKIILGNPPYSASNKDSQSKKRFDYPKLDKLFKDRYHSGQASKNNSYLLALLWATERLAKADFGIISYIIPNGWINASSMQNMRKTLSSAFAFIYIFNCRGASAMRALTCPHEDQIENEGESIFGTSDGHAIIFLIKDKNFLKGCQIFYQELKNKLTVSQKLQYLNEHENLKQFFNNTPPRHLSFQNEIINQTAEDNLFYNENYYSPIKQGKKIKFQNYIFKISTNGVVTNREAYCWDHSSQKLTSKITKLIATYETARQDFQNQNKNLKKEEELKEWIDQNNYNVPTIKWTRKLRKHLSKKKTINFNSHNIIDAMYYPLVTKKLYYNKYLNEEHCLLPQIFSPKNGTYDRIPGILITQKNNNFSALAINKIFYLNMCKNGLWFPLPAPKNKLYNRSHNFNPQWIVHLQNIYSAVSPQDIYYYIYAVLNHRQYQKTFQNIITNTLARLPIIKYQSIFQTFVEKGKKLFNLHLNYDNFTDLDKLPYQFDLSQFTNEDFLLDIKIYFTNQNHKKLISSELKKMNNNASINIVYNSKITLPNIPFQDLQWKIGEKIAIEWIASGYWNHTRTEERSNFKVKMTQTINDGIQEWVDKSYIVKLLIKTINTSAQTVQIINSLPEIDWLDKNNFYKLQ